LNRSLYQASMLLAAKIASTGTESSSFADFCLGYYSRMALALGRRGTERLFKRLLREKDQAPSVLAGISVLQTLYEDALRMRVQLLVTSSSLTEQVNAMIREGRENNA